MKEQNKITEEQEQALNILQKMMNIEKRTKRIIAKFSKIGIKINNPLFLDDKVISLLDEILGEQLASCLINKSSDLVKSVEDIKAIIESR